MGVQNRTWCCCFYTNFWCSGWGGCRVPTGIRYPLPQMKKVLQLRNTQGFTAYFLLKVKSCGGSACLNWPALFILGWMNFWEPFLSLILFSREWTWTRLRRWGKFEEWMGRTPNERLEVKRQTSHFPCGPWAGHNTTQTLPSYQINISNWETNLSSKNQPDTWKHIDFYSRRLWNFAVAVWLVNWLVLPARAQPGISGRIFGILNFLLGVTLIWCSI